MSNTPAINFYGMLSDLGDNILAAQERRKAQEIQDADRKWAEEKGFAAPIAKPEGFLQRMTRTLTGEQEQPQVPAAPVADPQPQPMRAAPNGAPSGTLYSTLISKGASPNEAAMLTGEAEAESRFNPATVHDSGTGYGLWGHRNERRDALFKFAGTQTPNLEQQAEFALKELRSRPESRDVAAAKTPEELAIAGMRYERPLGYTDANPQGGHNWGGRLDAIKRAYAGPGDTGARVQVAGPAMYPSGAPASIPAGNSGEVPDTVRRLGFTSVQDIHRGLGSTIPGIKAMATKALELYSKEGANEDTAEIKNYKYYAKQAIDAGQHPMPFDQWATAKAKAAATSVNIDTKGETKFAEETGKGLAKKFQDISDEGTSAQQDFAMLQQLHDLGGQIGTGGGAALQGWLAEHGIKVGANVDKVEAYKAIIDKLTPQQRVPGTGATSDYDARMFKSSLPGLINTPEGNSIIESTLASVAKYKEARAVIAEKAQIGEISAKDAVKALRELPSPYEDFKKFNKGEFAPPGEKKASSDKPFKPYTKDVLLDAKEAIPKKGRDAVLKVLKDNGYDTSKLPF